MKIKDVLQRDPSIHPLVNQGQARITGDGSEKAEGELRGELSTFVCEGQYADGIQRILAAYLDNLPRTNQKAAWVSGFFGSGKSHLLKMLCHLWVDTKFPDGATARSLVPAMPDELRSQLRELDTAGRRAGGLLAAAGALPGGSTDQVRLTVLGVLLRGAGLPELYPSAQFCLWLHEQGWFDGVKSAVEAAGKTWAAELNNLYVSGPIARALMARDPHFAASEGDARSTLRTQFPQRSTDLTTEEMLTAVRRVLKLRGRDGKLPCTLLVLDEVQQYIGDSNDRSTIFTEVTEALSKQLDSTVLLVASGQSALTATRWFQKLNDRYTIRVQLSDQDVEAVVRKVLLQKKASAVAPVKEVLEKHAGEVSRHLHGTRIGEVARDREDRTSDYPLLPVRRRFWEHCFRAVDAAGTHSQLRSQLRIIHDAVARISDCDVQVTVPGDDLFEALALEMVNTGVLLRELFERIKGLAKDGSEDGKLGHRICGLVFLISKLPREAGADIGVRGSKEHIADLLVSDLSADNGKLRSRVSEILERLSADGVLMKVGDEYRLQTKEGAEWDGEFRKRQAALANDDADLQIRRDQLLYAEVDRIVRSVKLLHGAAKVSRQLVLYRDQVPPPPAADCVQLWVRDAWSCAEKDVVEAARVAGTDSPTLFAVIPRKEVEDLRRSIIDAEAAQQTIDFKGTPGGPEGAEAKKSMESRREVAARQRDELVTQIVGITRVYQGGGAEMLQLLLADKIREAATASLVRLFPRFKDADSGAWPAVIKRAREGADQPLSPVGHTAPTEQHPVCQQVLSSIGAGRTGGDVRKILGATPFGFPQDAIDAAIIALHRSQHVSATWNGSAVAAGQLDQSKIGKAELRVERITLNVQDRIALRKLFQAAEVVCKPGEELARAPVFLDEVIALGRATGGPAPLPPPPSTLDLESIRSQSGNEQLAALRDKASSYEKLIVDWRRTRNLVLARRPVWDTVDRLARHAAGLEEAGPLLAQVEAVRADRLLLEPTDPVSPLRGDLTQVLRKAVVGAHVEHLAAYEAAKLSLEANPLWQRLDAEHRASILVGVGLVTPAAPDASTDALLLNELDGKPLASRRGEADAVTGRVQRALEQAARLLEPKVRPFAIERATLATPEDVREWLDRQQKALLTAIEDGPVLVS